MVRAEFHFLRDFILSPLPVITERVFFPPHPPYRSPKAGSRAFNGPWEHVSVKLPHCGALTRETNHIHHNSGHFISSGIFVSKRNVIHCGHHDLPKEPEDEPCTHSLLKVKRLRSVLIRSPLRSVHVVSEKRCRAQRRTQRTDARKARGELVYFPDGRGALRGHCPPAETCAFYFRYKSTFQSH